MHEKHVLWSPGERQRPRLYPHQSVTWPQVLFPLESKGVKARKASYRSYVCSLHEFRTLTQVGQESNLHPAVVETPSDAHGLKTSKLAIWLKLVWVL